MEDNNSYAYCVFDFDEAMDIDFHASWIIQEEMDNSGIKTGTYVSEVTQRCLTCAFGEHVDIYLLCDTLKIFYPGALKKETVDLPKIFYVNNYNDCIEEAYCAKCASELGPDNFAHDGYMREWKYQDFYNMIISSQYLHDYCENCLEVLFDKEIDVA